ncbi:MAG: hypothetical protein PHF23_06735 [Smithellaceae bacterium]|nr:hypothetical protein [Smithellaceae bacterium]
MNENLSFAIEILEGKKREYKNMERNSLDSCVEVKEAINTQIQKCDMCLEYLKSISDHKPPAATQNPPPIGRV